MKQIGSMLMSLSLISIIPSDVWASSSTFELELETGKVWQGRNDVQIPNSTMGSRFSLVDIAGNGPLSVSRAYLTWNRDDKHSFRALYAPLSYTKTGNLTSTINFSGQTYNPGLIDATYQFNSYRLGYRYRYIDDNDLQCWVGFTAKIRDAKIELAQGSTTNKYANVGFVPLFYFGANWQLSQDWYFLFDFDGLAGGPGRAFDVALKLGYDLSDDFSFNLGYRTVEGGVDNDSVYNFAWFHYIVVAGVYRF